MVFCWHSSAFFLSYRSRRVLRVIPNCWSNLFFVYNFCDVPEFVDDWPESGDYSYGLSKFGYLTRFSLVLCDNSAHTEYIVARDLSWPRKYT